jgi:putative transposase
LSLVGEGGLLGKATKMVLENAVEGQISDHLGYRTQATLPGVTAATVATGVGPRPCSRQIGPVEVEVPRDRQSTFDPKIVAQTPTQTHRGRGSRDLAVGQTV